MRLNQTPEIIYGLCELVVLAAFAAATFVWLGVLTGAL